MLILNSDSFSHLGKFYTANERANRRANLCRSKLQCCKRSKFGNNFKYFTKIQIYQRLPLKRFILLE